MKITNIDHVGIAVADLDTAIAFYEKAYGMTCVHTEVNAEQGVREAMLQVADSYIAIAASRSATAIPTWSMCVIFNGVS